MKYCPICSSIVTPIYTDQHVLLTCQCGWQGHGYLALKEPTLPKVPLMPYVSIDIETTGLDPETCQILEVGAVIDDWHTSINRLPRFRRVLIHDAVSGGPGALALNANLLKLIANTPKPPTQPIYHAVWEWMKQCNIKLPIGSAILQVATAHDFIRWCDVPNMLLTDGMTQTFRAQLLDVAANPPGTSCFCKDTQLSGLFHNWLVACGMTPMDLQAAGKNFAAFDMQFLNRLPGFTEVVKFRHRVLDPAILFWQPGDERLPGSKTCYERAGIDNKVSHTAVEDALAVVRLIRMGIKNLKGM